MREKKESAEADMYTKMLTKKNKIIKITTTIPFARYTYYLAIGPISFCMIPVDWILVH